MFRSGSLRYRSRCPCCSKPRGSICYSGIAAWPRLKSVPRVVLLDAAEPTRIADRYDRKVCADTRSRRPGSGALWMLRAVLVEAWAAWHSTAARSSPLPHVEAAARRRRCPCLCRPGIGERACMSLGIKSPGHQTRLDRRDRRGCSRNGGSTWPTVIRQRVLCSAPQNVAPTRY